MELVRYNAAKQALADCESIDECKDWKDKGAAMATYAKMRNDKELENKARRIRGRATRRLGELLLEVQAQQGRRTDRELRGGKSPKLQTRKSMATAAGLSADEAKLAIRVARAPEADFEELIEGEIAPTLDELAELGRRIRQTTEEERREQYRKDALKDFQKWQGRYNQCPEMTSIKKSIFAIHRAFSDGISDDHMYFFEDDK